MQHEINITDKSENEQTNKLAELPLDEDIESESEADEEAVSSINSIMLHLYLAQVTQLCIHVLMFS